MIDFVVGRQTDSILKNGGRPTKSFFWGRWLFCPWTIKQTQEQSRGSFWVGPMYYHVGSRTVTSRQFVGRRVPRGWKKTAQGLNFNTLVLLVTVSAKIAPEKRKRLKKVVPLHPFLLESPLISMKLRYTLSKWCTDRPSHVLDTSSFVRVVKWATSKKHHTSLSARLTATKPYSGLQENNVLAQARIDQWIYHGKCVFVLTRLNSRVKFMSRKIWCMRVVIEWDRVSVRVRVMKPGCSSSTR